MKHGFTIRAAREHAVGHYNVIVHVTVESAAKPMHESHRTEARLGGSSRTAVTQRSLHCTQEHSEQAACNLRFLPHVPAEALWHAQYPLAERNSRQHFIGQVGGCLDHAACGAGRADITTLAGKGNEKTVATASAIGPRKAVCQYAALQVGAKRGLAIGRNSSGEVFILVAGEIGFQVVAYGLVQNGLGWPAWAIDGGV